MAIDVQGQSVLLFLGRDNEQAFIAIHGPSTVGSSTGSAPAQGERWVSLLAALNF
jgi:hypothetical protein